MFWPSLTESQQKGLADDPVCGAGCTSFFLGSPWSRGTQNTNGSGRITWLRVRMPHETVPHPSCPVLLLVDTVELGHQDPAHRLSCRPCAAISEVQSRSWQINVEQRFTAGS